MKTAFALLVLCLTARAETFEAAAEHLQAGRFAQARTTALAVPERNKQYVRAQYLAGDIGLLTGQTEEATKAYRRALKAKPGSAPILTGLGRALVAGEEFDEAVKVLTRAVKKDPKSGRAHCFLGIATRNKTYGSKGGKSIAKGVKLAPTDPVVARAAVLYWLEEQEPKKALAAATAFRKQDKKAPMASFLEALVHENAQDYGDAIESYQAAIKLDPKFLDAHKNLAILCIAQNPMYKDKKRTDLAMKHFAEYRKLGGRDTKVIQIHETLKKFVHQFTGGEPHK